MSLCHLVCAGQMSPTLGVTWENSYHTQMHSNRYMVTSPQYGRSAMAALGYVSSPETALGSSYLGCHYLSLNCRGHFWLVPPPASPDRGECRSESGQGEAGRWDRVVTEVDGELHLPPVQLETQSVGRLPGGGGHHESICPLGHEA